jgi:hypothetical protein
MPPYLYQLLHVAAVTIILLCYNPVNGDYYMECCCFLTGSPLIPPKEGYTWRQLKKLAPLLKQGRLDVTQDGRTALHHGSKGSVEDLVEPLICIRLRIFSVEQEESGYPQV